MISALCGVGPGTPCDGTRSRCDGSQLLSCISGKESLTDCRMICRELGDPNGRLYDGGGCVGSDGDSTCKCCDVGEPGCEHETRGPPTRILPLAPPVPPSR